MYVLATIISYKKESDLNETQSILWGLTPSRKARIISGGPGCTRPYWVLRHKGPGDQKGTFHLLHPHLVSVSHR